MTSSVGTCSSPKRLATAFQRDPAFDLPTYWQAHLHEFVTAFSEYEFTLRIHPDRLNFARWLTAGRNLLVNTDAHGWHTVKF